MEVKDSLADRIITQLVPTNCILRDFLRSKYSGRRIHFLREGGKIFLNAKEVTVRAKAKAGDKLTLIFSEQESFNYAPKDMGLKAVYEDEDLLVVFKPKGVACMPVAPHFNANLLNGLAFLRPNVVFRVVTRLDANTSGLVLVAKNALSHSILYDKVREMQKTYVALAEGEVTAPQTIDMPIFSDGGRKRLVDERGKRAITQILSSQKMGENSLLKINLLTGRTHQIRVHLSHVGHPLVGDDLYGSKTSGGQILVCESLSFVHPITEKAVEVHTDAIQEVQKRLNDITG